MDVSEAVKASEEAWAEERGTGSKSKCGVTEAVSKTSPAQLSSCLSRPRPEVCSPEGSLDMGTPGTEERMRY